MAREADPKTRRVWFLSRGRPWKEMEVQEPLPGCIMVAAERHGDHDRVLACFPADRVSPEAQQVFYTRRFDRVLIHDGCVEPTSLYVEWCA